MKPLQTQLYIDREASITEKCDFYYEKSRISVSMDRKTMTIVMILEGM